MLLCRGWLSFYEGTELETVGDKRIRISHPDYLVFSPDQKYLAAWVGHNYNVLAPHQIASLHITPESEPQSAS